MGERKPGSRDVRHTWASIGLYRDWPVSKGIRSSAKRSSEPTEEIANEADHVCLDGVVRST